MVNTFFGGTVLDGMAHLSEEYLPDTVDVYAPVKVSKPGGGNTITYPTVETTYNCRVSPISAFAALETIIAGRLGQPKKLWVLILPRGTVIGDDRRIIVTSADESWTKVLNIVGSGAQFDTETMTRVVAEEL